MSIMKKISFLAFIFGLILLAGCGKQDILDDGVLTGDLSQTGDILETGDEQDSILFTWAEDDDVAEVWIASDAEKEGNLDWEQENNEDAKIFDEYNKNAATNSGLTEEDINLAEKVINKVSEIGKNK